MKNDGRFILAASLAALWVLKGKGSKGFQPILPGMEDSYYDPYLWVTVTLTGGCKNTLHWRRIWKDKGWEIYEKELRNEIGRMGKEGWTIDDDIMVTKTIPISIPTLEMMTALGEVTEDIILGLSLWEPYDVLYTSPQGIELYESKNLIEGLIQAIGDQLQYDYQDFFWELDFEIPVTEIRRFIGSTPNIISLWKSDE